MAASWLGTQAALDILIAALSAHLLHGQRPCADQKVKSVIDRLIRGAIQAAAIPLLFGAAALATFCKSQ